MGLWGVSLAVQLQRIAGLPVIPIVTNVLGDEAENMSGPSLRKQPGVCNLL